MMAMEDKTLASRESLVFAVNGERFELSTVDPSTTLLQFLRSRTRFKSVKLSCGEGGCGACLVLLSKYDPVSEEVESFSVNSCLTLLCSIDRCSITTSEGLGNSKDGFHPIHQRFAGFHASQCGFCTPGMCMSLFSALTNAEKAPRPEPSPGFSKLTASEAEKAIAGNLCRCTGYRPIADACKTFASDIDMEDLGLNSFWKKEDSREEKISRLPPYSPKDQVCTFPEFLKKDIATSVLLDAKKYPWLSPISIKEPQNILRSYTDESGLGVKSVVGNTGAGYYKEVNKYEKYIDLRHIPDLLMIRKNEEGIELGAAVTISKAILSLKEVTEKEFLSQGDLVYQKIASHLEKVASGFIRNSASVGGNLVMAQRRRFPSDIATILLSVDSTVNIMTNHGNEKLALEEFLEKPPLDSKSVLLSVHIPSHERYGARDANTRWLFETYRAAPRPHGNALAYLNAAFLAEITPCKTSDGVLIISINLAFGAYGTKLLENMGFGDFNIRVRD